MFYANAAPYIRSQSTVLSPTQVFVGDYWDEFAMTHCLIPDQANVLVLGLARGGGIRPLCASAEKLILTTVDLDPASNQACREYFDRYFPSLEFAIHEGCAYEFVKSSQQKFDAIWVDVYGPDTYWATVFKAEFWQSIRECLTPNGVVLVNSFGLPIQFDPLGVSAVQRNLARKLSAQFAHLHVVPHRRNLTFIASTQPLRWHQALPHSDLNSTDKMSFAILSEKARTASALRIRSAECAEPKASEMRFAEIDQQMLASWELILEDIRQTGHAISQRKELIDFIQGEKNISDYLRNGSPQFLIFVPVLAAGQSRLMNLELEGLWRWFFENADRLRNEISTEFYQIWLPQMWNVLIGSERKYLHHRFSFSALLKKGGN